MSDIGIMNIRGEILKEMEEKLLIEELVERAIQFNEDWVIDMVMNESVEDLMFKRAIQAYEGNRELCKEELI